MRHIFRQSSIYGSAEFISKGIAFLLIPVITYFLAVEDYGRLSLYQTYQNVLSVLLLWGTTASMASFYHFKEYRDRFEQIKDTTLRLLLVVNLAVMLFVYAISVMAGTDPLLTALVLISAYLASAKTVESTFFIHSEQPRKQFTLVVSFALISAVLVVLSLIFSGRYDPVDGIFGATALAGLLFFLAIAVRNGFYLRHRFNWQLTREVLAFGLPVLPHALAQWVLNFSDRVMLKLFHSLTDVGLYSLGYNFGMVLLMVLGGLSTSWGPSFMRTAENDNDARRTLSDMARKLWLVICFVAAGYIIWINELVIVATPSGYHSAIPVSKTIILSYVIYGSYLLYANGLFAARKSRLVPLATISAAVVNILLNAILIPGYGLWGAVAATAISFTLMSYIIYRLTMKHYPLDVDLFYVGKVFAVPLAALAVSVPLDQMVSLLPRLAAKTGIVAIAAGWVYVKFRE